MIGWLTIAWAGPEVVVLGIAQDGGHPQAGCTRTCCAAAWDDPALGHRVASLGIVDGDQVWIVDATPDFAAQWHTLQVREAKLAGILLTHAHMGHWAGLLDLGREVMGATEVPVYAMPRMRAVLEAEQPWASLVSQRHIAVQPLTHGVPVVLSPRVTVVPFLVPHRDELSETVGYRIVGPTRAVVWLPDIDKWDRWTTPIEQMLADVDVAYVDGTFYAGGEVARDMAEIPHPFITETLARLRTAPTYVRQKIRFVHLNHTNPALAADGGAAGVIRAAGMAVAREGERLDL